MTKLIRIVALSVMASILLGAGFACETTAGAGKDIEKGGKNLKDAANDAKS